MNGNILWIIYLGLLGTTAIFFLIKGMYKTTLTKVDFVISIITWIGLFGFVTNIQILTPLVWKIVFFGGIAWDIFFGLFIQDHYEDEDFEDIPKAVRIVLSFLMLVILIGPLYYGLYHYAF
ncbi:hypothetical protein JOC75_001684 [Metabacillus crassostreae]|uniref:hypothetical protein n=1 Tax=Metabacillus crassostreae TaxID=929098 RepID=UPI001EF8C8C3|nr:hypothetical protein [Metabacillus crassostreae]MBM7603711.1 hypothetical protein [Metabacillus crassostreae]